MISVADKAVKKQPRVCNELTDEEKNWLMDCSNFETQGESQKVHKKKSVAKKSGPRKPLSAYNFFFREQKKIIARERAAARLNKVDFEALGKMIGGRWKVVPPNELTKFKAMAEADRKRYKREMEAYLRGASPVASSDSSIDFEEINTKQLETHTPAAKPLTATPALSSSSSTFAETHVRLQGVATTGHQNSLAKQLLNGRKLQDQQASVECAQGTLFSSIEPVPVSSFGPFFEVHESMNQDLQLLGMLESCLNDDKVPLEITANDSSWMEPTPIAPSRTTL